MSDPNPVKLVRVYRADDPNRTLIFVPESEIVPPSAPGMPDYRLADRDDAPPNPQTGNES